MSEFRCPCGGRIWEALSFDDQEHKIAIYACNKCNRTWIDSPVSPLKQEKIDKFYLED